MAAKHLVLAGGGHAHLLTIHNIKKFVKKGHRVTVVSPSDFHYYSGMGPGLLRGVYSPQQVRFDIGRLVRESGGEFCKGRVARIMARQNCLFLEDGTELGYDVLSCNLGSVVPKKIDSDDHGTVVAVKPIENLYTFRNRLLEGLQYHKNPSIAIIGGGASSVELATNLRALMQAKEQESRITVFAGRRMLGQSLPRLKRHVEKALTAYDIAVNEDGYAVSYINKEVALEDGSRHSADFVLLAHGITPSPIFAQSDLPVGPDGGLSVNENLQSVGFDNLFGGGDCIYFSPRPLDKVGVYAYRQNLVLLNNIKALLSGDPDAMVSFQPQKKYMLIFNVACRKGIFFKGRLCLEGRFFWWLKDYIDRRFMRNFQRLKGR